MKRIVADKFIMLGDFHIQNPYVKNEQNLNFAFDENNKLKMNYSMSLFQRLFNQDRSKVSYLSHQYRMNKQIFSFINKSIYSDSLFDGKTEDELLPMNSKFIYPSIVYPFLRYVCYSKPCVALINTSHLSKIMQDLSSSCINTTIVNLVVEVLQTVEIINPDEITVISNVKDVEHEEILKSKGITNCKVIDNLYDAENNIVICNIVVNSKQDSSINNLFRMCAAFGKAIKKRIIIFNNKDILFENIIISDCEVLKTVDKFRPIINYCESNNHKVNVESFDQAWIKYVPERYQPSLKDYLEILESLKGESEL